MVAWTLLSASALATGNPFDVGWSAVIACAVVAAVALARVRLVRRAFALTLAGFTAVLTAVTLATGSAPWFVDSGERMALFTGNPNLLGASLVASFAAWAAVAPGRRWVWWGWPLVALAVLHTGSRASGGALLAAATVWLVLTPTWSGRRRLVAPILATLVIATAVVGWQRLVVDMTPNLLAAPSDYQAGVWNRTRAERLEIIDDATPGPHQDTSAQRLMGQARPDGRLVIYQSIGRSEADVPYVASVYLRADTPQQVRLSSNLARVTCDVDTQWRRCITPVGWGNDRSQRQHALSTVDRGGSFDVFLFGAQYERGVEATAFVDGRPAWLPQAMVNRYDPRRISLLDARRVESVRAGLDILRDHPWFGIGRTAAPEAIEARMRAAGATPLPYVHNLLAQLLAVQGLVGLLGWVLLIAAVFSLVPRQGLLRLAPLLVGLVLVNSWDITFVAPTAFLPTLLAVAYWTAAEPSRRTGPSSQRPGLPSS